MCLRIIPGAYIVTRINMPAHGRYLTGDRAQQGCLTRAIGSQQPDTVPTQHFQVSNSYQYRWRIANGKLLGRKYNLSTIYDRIELEMHFWKISYAVFCLKKK